MPRLLLVILGAMLLAGALFTISSAFTGEGRSRRITDADADADGEPDETPSEKARALKDMDTE